MNQSSLPELQCTCKWYMCIIHVHVHLTGQVLSHMYIYNYIYIYIYIHVHESIIEYLAFLLLEPLDLVSDLSEQILSF